MLSVLIPTYNYDITKLVRQLHEQLLNAQIQFEIICLDDVSKEHIIAENKDINRLTYTTYHLSKKNRGIAITRQRLCEMATYDWILLLDADTMLKGNRFILNYLENMNAGYDFIFGGFDYQDIKPHEGYLLRWAYGRQYEALNASGRNANPYKITIAANLLARKAAYLDLNLGSIGKQYAMDYYFGALLKETKSKVLHLNNNVYHLGIEKSESYLRKKEKAAETLINLYRENKIKDHANDLLSTYIFLKRLKLNYLFAGAFKLFRSPLKNNLLGKRPIILLLQFYKILYICHFDLFHGSH